MLIIPFAWKYSTLIINYGNKSQISVDKGTSTGLTIGNVGVRKLSHRYSDSKGQTQFMYYHRIIVNLKKLSSGNKFCLHILVNIPQDGTDLAVYPRQFSGVYMIVYGITSTVSNMYPDKVYDYHTAFDIHPTEVVYNVDINANQRAIKNTKLDRNSDNSAATVRMVKELVPYTVNNVYRQYFENFYDFTDASNNKKNLSSSGVSFNGMNPGFAFPTKNIQDLDYSTNGLKLSNYNCTIDTAHSINFTICFVINLPRSNTTSFRLSSTMKNTQLNTTFEYHGAVNKSITTAQN